MHQIELYGHTMGQDDLGSFIMSAVQGHPQVPMYDAPGDGAAYLVELWSAVRGSPLEPLARVILDRLLQHAEGEELVRLARVANQVEGAFAAETLQGALLRQRQVGAGDDEAAFPLASGLAREILAGRHPYDPALRNLAQDPAIKGALTGCYVCHDHAWFLDHARELLGEEVRGLINHLSRAAAPLSRGELRALQAELLDQARGFSDSIRPIVQEYFDEIADRPLFAERGDAVRW